jgi:hypothetical protein
MRKIARTALAAAALATGLIVVMPAAPAAAGTCYDIYVYTNPPSGATVCVPF